MSRATEVFEEVLARVVALSDLPEAEVHPLLLRARGARAAFASLGIYERSLEARSVYHMLHATMACHAAARAGDPLGEELVRRLVSRSGDVDFFAHCPHGRPVYRRFTETPTCSRASSARRSLLIRPPWLVTFLSRSTCALDPGGVAVRP